MSQSLERSVKGQLVCVGTGLRLAGQLTPIAKSHIENADVVVGAVANGFSRHFIQGLAKEYVCLWRYYGDGGAIRANPGMKLIDKWPIPLSVWSKRAKRSVRCFMDTREFLLVLVIWQLKHYGLWIILP